MDPDQPDFVRIDLESGRNETIGAGKIRPGHIAVLTELSPDGKRLGFMEMASDRSVLLQQVRWMDVESGAVSDIGKPVEGFGHFSWLPVGNGIVFVRASGGTNMNDVPGRMLAVMRFDGAVTDLGEGDAPIVLRKSQRVLYRASGDGAGPRWMTMDLNGGDKKPLGGGLTKFVFAAVDPEETKIYFQKQAGERELQPHVFEFGNGEPKRVTTLEGYFGPAAWR
jgi:hypothetical protein